MANRPLYHHAPNWFSTLLALHDTGTQHTTWRYSDLLVVIYLNPKFQVSHHLLQLYSTVCVGPVGNPKDRLSHEAAHMMSNWLILFWYFQSLPQDILDFKGKIQLTNFDRDYHIVEYYGNQPGQPTDEPETIYFGQWVRLGVGVKTLHSKNCLAKDDMSLVLRKPVFGVFDQVRHKPGCTAVEYG